MKIEDISYLNLSLQSARIIENLVGSADIGTKAPQKQKMNYEIKKMISIFLLLLHMFIKGLIRLPLLKHII